MLLEKSNMAESSFKRFYETLQFFTSNKTQPSAQTCPTHALSLSLSDVNTPLRRRLSSRPAVNPVLSSRLLPLSFSREWKVHSEENASAIMGAATFAPVSLTNARQKKPTFAPEKEGSDRKIDKELIKTNIKKKPDE